ncbi:cell division protein FtsW, partial [Candidatus Saccharibacteria bacterium]|nr:cell division protein FtsW [Candidatus Saccharibacteria bacterium]
LAFVLTAIGLVVIYSIGSSIRFNLTNGQDQANIYFKQQVISLLIGLTGLLVASQINYKYYKKFAIPILIIGIILISLLLVEGIAQNVNGATRWLSIGPVNFQPTELFKLAIIIYLARQLSKNPDQKTQITLVSIILVFLLVTLLQRDLGSSIILILEILSIYWISGAKFREVSLIIGVLLAGTVLMIAIEPFRLRRVLTFLGESTDPSGAGYHIQQALIALGSGSITGRGLGNSIQIFGYLPEAHTDSIFAVIGEQLGLIGSLVIGSIFIFLILRSTRLINKAPDDFARFMVIGIVSWIAFQTLMNIGAMVGLVPLTGIPLPFISYGGSNLIVNLVAIGILLNISKYTKA